MARNDISATRRVHELLEVSREPRVMGRQGWFIEEFGRSRGLSSIANADYPLVQQLPKYILESVMIVGAGALAAVLFATQPIGPAAATLVLYLAAGSRILPALLRFQGAALMVKTASKLAESTFALVHELGKASRVDSVPHLPSSIPHDVTMPLRGQVTAKSLSVRYSRARKPALESISFSVDAGSRVAIIGPSGAGKSPLADALLDLAPLTSGFALIDGRPPSEFYGRGPGGIAYSPQNITLVGGSIRDNVTLELPDDGIDETDLWVALKNAQLDHFVADLPEKLATQIGNKGLALSGGQRQRLGLARSLFAKPRLLVLDEATSALDVETEAAVIRAIEQLQGECTVFVVAHRLTTVESADVIIYLDDGQIQTMGNFAQVSASFPSLSRQAGLTSGPEAGWCMFSNSIMSRA